MKNAGRQVVALVGMALIGCAQPSDPGAVSGVGGAGSGAASGSTGGGSPTGTGGGSATTQTTVSAISGSRLKAYWITATDGSQQFADQWRDTQLNIDCAFGVASDGQYRCLPTYMGSASYFSDSGCSTAIQVGEIICTMTATQTPGYINVTQTTGTACSATSTSALHTAGGQYTGTLYSGTPASCTNIGSALANEGFMFYSVGSVVDVTMFAQATRNYQ